MEVYCPECGTRETLTPDRYCCQCGGAWESVERADFDPAWIDATEASLWRYRRLYDLNVETPIARLGAGWTPLIPMMFNGRIVSFKLEYLAPTGSFKDRGTELMINVLAEQKVTHVADDSSGNAGAAVAAYAARAGMRADIFVPSYASPAKQAQIAVYGAQVHPIPGPRSNARQAVLESIRRGVVLASHAYHPGFLLGQESVAWEVWEQLGRRTPDWVVVPVGQGVHLLGYWLGFRRLQAAGLIDHLPRLVGVQAAALAPVCRALESGLDRVPGVEPSSASVAEGLAIAQPVRGRRLLQAIRQTYGACITVQDPAILSAQNQLARHGLHVEPTSATAVAALDVVFQQAAPDEIIVVPLTGHGLKGTPGVSPATGN